MTNRPWAALAVFVLAAPAAAQPPGKPDYIKDNVLDNSCLRCHMAPREGDVDRKALQFILLRESEYWSKHDLHRRAFDALSSPLGKEMAKRLYGDEAKAAVTPACLVCHSTDGKPEVPLARKTADQFYCQYGVNCQACHGPASEWASKHYDDTVWRQKHPKDKAAAGQVNLRGTAVRAEKCVSCHVGSAAEGKFVTHEVYAAGHPPLPPFELATFSRDEPMHWRPAADVPYIATLDATKAKEHFSHRKGETEAARLDAVGAVVALRESVKLLAFDPDPAKPADRLDFAHFNCSACHHDLRLPAARQANGFPGVPGRPVPTTWPVWAVEAVLRHAEQGKAGDVRKKFEASYGALRTEFDRAPFGDRAAVVKQAEDVRKACDDLLAVLDATEFDAKSADALVRELAAAAGGKPLGRRDYLDADGASQLARAAAAIRYPAKVGPDGKPPEAAPAFAGPFKLLGEKIGLTARDAYRNADLLQVDGTFGKRVKRAADYEADPSAVLDAIRGLGRPPRETK